MKDLEKALGVLLCLSAATTLFASFINSTTVWIIAPILILSGWKARVILNVYLDLGQTRFWRRGFNTFVGFFLTVAITLYFLPTVV